MPKIKLTGKVSGTVELEGELPPQVPPTLIFEQTKLAPDCTVSIEIGEVVPLVRPEQVKAVKETINMWEWLYLRPWATKHGYLVGHDPSAHLNCECYLCDIWHSGCEANFNKNISDKCPLAQPGLHCVYSLGNPYLKWTTAKTVDEKKKHARRIIEACYAWLNRHGIS